MQHSETGARPLAIKDLLVCLAPETSERGTEKHFADLFRTLKWVAPPHYELGTDLNPTPDENSVLLFEGGTDISTSIYKQEKSSGTQNPDLRRDTHEISMWMSAIKVRTPMIGICRGAQLLCALNGGTLIQHINGHSGGNFRHQMVLPKCFQSQEIEVTSAHHQMMNPYNLPPGDWKSLGHVPRPLSGKYYGEYGQKIKVHKLYTDFKEQEIIWFPKTKSLCIQGHPEYIHNRYHPFVSYCRMLIKVLILGEKTAYDILA